MNAASTPYAVTESTARRLRAAAEQFGTPLYAYDAAAVQSRFDLLERVFERRFTVSFAVKSNPNVGLLRTLWPRLTTFDASSFGEVERALRAGTAASRVTFSGPAKRKEEIERAVRAGVGEMVIESITEAAMIDQAARKLGRVQDVLIRINPLRVPRHFGVSMAGKPSQFGVDEEVVEAAIDHLAGLRNLRLVGFHIYSGTNSLNPDAIAENFEIFVTIFRRAAAHARLAPQKLIFGSGFGVPYIPGEQPLDVEAVARKVNPLVDDLKRDPAFAKSECVLEMGRWLVAPFGWLLTSVVGEKVSRGTEFRLCDAGFNNHLAACGMMGTVIRRNWNFANVSNVSATPSTYTLVGPLCTTIDILASAIELPQVRVGDVIAIANSGAYGITSSPTRFISHPEPREVLLEGDTVRDVTESLLNHWSTA